MLGPMNADHIDRCVELWNQTQAAKFRIDRELFQQNVFGSPLLVPEATKISVDGSAFVVVKRAAPELYPGPEPTWYHINSLIGDDSVRAKLLESALSEVQKLGCTKLFMGQDLRHFWPGAPVEDSALSELLLANGFTEGEFCCDLERDMQNYEIPSGVMERAAHADFRACSMSDVPLLDEFFVRAFPRRWRYDVMEKIRVEGRADMVFGVFVDGVCEGFAITQQDGCKMPIGGGVWRNDMGLNWGSLGPIGVSERVRGQGLGNAILAYGLAGLRDRGVRQCIIDWTTLRDFYGGHGFLPTREYRCFSLTL